MILLHRYLSKSLLMFHVSSMDFVYNQAQGNQLLDITLKEGDEPEIISVDASGEVSDRAFFHQLAGPAVGDPDGDSFASVVAWPKSQRSSEQFDNAMFLGCLPVSEIHSVVSTPACYTTIRFVPSMNRSQTEWTVPIVWDEYSEYRYRRQ